MCVGYHASHITFVLSKAALSACLCVCEREPPAHFAYLVPERIALRTASLLYAEHAARAAGESVQRELQVLALPHLLVKTEKKKYHGTIRDMIDRIMMI